MISASYQKTEESKTSETRAENDEEFKKNAAILSCASPITVKQISEALGRCENLLYRWRKKWTPEGDKTRYAMLEEELKALKLENAGFGRSATC